MRLPLLIAIALVAAGCQAPSATGVDTKPSVRRGTPAPAATPAGTPAPSNAPVPTGPTRVIDPAKLGSEALASVQLIGKVKLISDKGAGILSNNSGSLIANNGGGLVSDKGSALVSNNSGSFRVLAEGAPAEALLAEARIDLVDAEGKQLVSADGQPIGATTDAQGNYQLSAQLPKENFLLRIRLFPSQNTGGELLAVLPSQAGARTVDIDTASSLGASYVLDRYVQKRQDVFNRLPASEAEALQRDMQTARAKLAKVPGYKPEEQIALVEELRGQTPALDDTLERIKALLLAGQKELGNGLPAVSVALSVPVAVMGDAAGNLLIVESFFGRVRKVGLDGTIGVYPKPDIRSFGLVHGAARSPDGTLYIAGFRTHQVFKVSPDGTVAVVAGNGQDGQTTVDVKATDAPLSGPAALALGPDGTLYIAEASDKGMGRILKVGADGLLREVEQPAEYRAAANLYGLAVDRDGTIIVVDGHAKQVRRLKPGGAWEVLAAGLGVSGRARVTLSPSGEIYISESDANRIFRLAADGTRALVAGTGVAGYTGDGGPASAARLSDPSGLYFAPSGTIYLADTGNGVIRSIGKDGIIRTVAGAQGASQIGDALAIALNGPAGLTVDAQGRLVVAESGAALIKRLDGNTLSVLAGTTRGFGGDGGPATAANLNLVMGVAYAGSDMYVLDAGNDVLRRIAADGTISTVAGVGRNMGPDAPLPSLKVEARQQLLRVATGLTVDPQGRPVWSDVDNNWVMRLNPDGTAEVIAGAKEMTAGYGGDGGPATAATLRKPIAVTYDKAGNLYIADTGNLVVRKVDPSGVITTVAGTAGQAGMLKIMAGGSDADGAAALGATIVGPAYLCTDAAGNLYVTEMGTTNLDALGFGDQLPTGVSVPVTHPKVRKVTPEGKIYTVAGPGSKLLADTTGDNRIGTPAGLAIDGEGRLIISDGGFNQLKLVPKGAF